MGCVSDVLCVCVFFEGAGCGFGMGWGVVDFDGVAGVGSLLLAEVITFLRVCALAGGV